VPWPFRRRKETLNERLLREAGLNVGSIAGETAPEHDPADLEDSWFDDRSLLPFERLSGEVTSARPRRWDAVVSAEAPEIRGDEAGFVALPDGSLVVDEGEAQGDLTPLADAVETRLEPPYRAQAVRRADSVWAVAARRIEVATFQGDGEEMTLARHGETSTLTVDGAETRERIPELERLGERQGGSYVVRARRLDGDLWETQVDRL
jgi:hypothetical protein